MPERVIEIGRGKAAGGEGSRVPFPGNSIRTHQYSAYPWRLSFFLYKNVYEQFNRIANLYFLVIAILQIIPGLSPTGQFTTLLTLSLVMGASAIRALVEDVRRYRKDQETNSQLTHVYDRDGYRWVKTQWKNVTVGDLVMVNAKECFPCDLILVASSDAGGLAYVETSSLDGETNLKSKQSLGYTSHFNDALRLKDFHAVLRCEESTPDLYSFNGALVLDSTDWILGEKQLLLRGSYLRKVHFAIGICVYTGMETKVMRNSNKTRYKRSKVEVVINEQLRWMFLVMIILCGAGAVLSTFNYTTIKTVWYFGINQSSSLGVEGIKSFVGYLILLNNLIPISLYVSVELVRLFQAVAIQNDPQMVSKDRQAVVRTSSLNEELGQVEYVFSDKTGTLTENKMKFMKFSCCGHKYGKGITEIGLRAARAKNKKVEDTYVYPPNDHDVQFQDARIDDGYWKGLSHADTIKEFFTALAVCNSVAVDIEDGQVQYQAESPDEAALVFAARHFGFQLIDRTSESISLLTTQGPQYYQILNIIPFTSDRKRMSIIVENAAGEVMLYAKGADNIIIQRLASHQEHLERSSQHLNEFSEEGLRTLMLANRPLSKAAVEGWLERWNKAMRMVSEERGEVLENLANEVEVDLRLIGVSAIEDKLQPNVSETIGLLRKAGMKVWMLTGDRYDMAVNVGLACEIISTDSLGRLIEVVGCGGDACYKALTMQLEALNQKRGDPPTLVVDSVSLAEVLKSKRLRVLFYEVACKCSSVICCRVAPMQKAGVVRLVRQFTKAVTLAIGDGANDVAMINESHVGVGISGLEGQQASNAADYSIASFRFLMNLTLFHGRWNYLRTCELVLYFFYKNAVLQVTQFLFSFYSGWSSNTLYDKWVLALYNLVFTSFPILVFALYDRETDDHELIKQNPELYLDGIQSKDLNGRKFIEIFFVSIFHGFVCYFAPNAISFAFPNARIVGLYDIGLLQYTCVILLVTGKLSLRVQMWNKVMLGVVMSTLAVWYLFNFIYGVIKPLSFDMFDVMRTMAGWLMYWISQVFVVAVGIIPLFFIKFYNINYNTNRRYIVYRLSALRPKVEEEEASPIKPTTDTEDSFGNNDNIAQLFQRTEVHTEVLDSTMNKYTLQFNDQSLERSFQVASQENLSRCKRMAYFGTIGGTIITMQSLVADDCLLVILMWSLWAIALAVFSVMLTLFPQFMSKNLHYVLLIVTATAFTVNSIAHFASAFPITHPSTLGICLLTLLAMVRPPIFAAVQYVGLSLLCYTVCLFPFRPDWDSFQTLARFLELIMVAFTGLITIYDSEVFFRKQFSSLATLEQKKTIADMEGKRGAALLRNVLPADIVRVIFQYNQQISMNAFTHHYEIGSVLFSDVAGFTTFSRKADPKTLVTMLNNLFVSFDRHMQRVGVQKIKTIGDAYVCAAGLPIADELHMERIVEMGLAIVQSVMQINLEHKYGINMRVGIAAGPITGGVLGFTKFSYDVFGPTVKHAEHMEQTSEPGKVQASETIYWKLKDKYDFEIDRKTGKERYFAVRARGDAVGHFPPIKGTVPFHPEVKDDSDRFLSQDQKEKMERSEQWMGFETKLSTYSLKFQSKEIELEYQKYRQTLGFKKSRLPTIIGAFIFTIMTPIYITLFTDCSSVTGCSSFEASSRCALDYVDLLKKAKESPPCCIALYHWIMVASYIFAFVHILMLGIRIFIDRANNGRTEDYQDNDNDDDEFADFTRDEDTVEPWKVTLIRTFCYFSIIGMICITFASIVVIKDRQMGVVLVFIMASHMVYVYSFYIFALATKLIITFIYTTLMLVTYYGAKQGTARAVDTASVIISVVVSVVSAYSLERAIRTQFATARKIAASRLHADIANHTNQKILYNVLPKVILHRMKANPTVQIVDMIESASVMFVYFSGTDSGDLQKMNEFIRMLDTILVQLGVEKIKTNPYLAVAGCPEPVRDHAERLVLASVKIHAAVKEYKARETSKIQMKIGIHAGKFFAGVLGSKTVVYDVFGEAVNFSQRLCATCPWGSVHISEAVYLKASHVASFKKNREKVKMKGYESEDLNTYVSSNALEDEKEVEEVIHEEVLAPTNVLVAREVYASICARSGMQADPDILASAAQWEPENDHFRITGGDMTSYEAGQTIVELLASKIGDAVRRLELVQTMLNSRTLTSMLIGLQSRCRVNAVDLQQCEMDIDEGRRLQSFMKEICPKLLVLVPSKPLTLNSVPEDVYKSFAGKREVNYMNTTPLYTATEKRTDLETEEEGRPVSKGRRASVNFRSVEAQDEDGEGKPWSSGRRAKLALDPEELTRRQRSSFQRRSLRGDFEEESSKSPPGRQTRSPKSIGEWDAEDFEPPRRDSFRPQQQRSLDYERAKSPSTPSSKRGHSPLDDSFPRRPSELHRENSRQ